MNPETPEESNSNKTKARAIRLGVAFGACIGLSLSFLIVQFTDWRIFENKTGIQGHESKNQLRGNEAILNAGETTRFIQTVLELEDETDSVFEKFDPTKLLSIMDLLANNKQYSDAVSARSLRNLVIAELALFDPEVTFHLLDYLPPLDRNELVHVIFSTWARADLQAALLATKQLSSSQWNVAVLAILESRPERLQEIEEFMESVKLTKSLETLIQEKEVRNLLSTNPREAWHSIARDSVYDEEQINLLQDVLSAWVYQEGFAVLDQIYASRHQYSSYVLNDLILETVKFQPQQAFLYANSLTRDKQRWLIPIIVEAWSTRDPQAAFQALETIDALDKRQIHSKIFQNWATHNPSNLLEALESLPRSQRGIAARNAISQITMESPQLAQEILTNWSDVLGVRFSELKRVFVRYWALQNPEEAYQWIVANESASNELYTYMLEQVLSNLSRLDPQKALDIALSQPETSHYVQTGYSFSNLLRSLGKSGHIDLVITVLDQVPVQSQVSTVNTLVELLVSAGRWEDAVQQGDNVNEDVRMWYFDRFGFHGCSTNVTELIKRLDSLPSDDIRAIVVKRVLAYHESTGTILTDHQLKHLRSLAERLPEVEYSPW